MLSISVVTLGGETIAKVRVSSQITVRELRDTVKEAVKKIKNTELGAHDLVYENTVLSLNKTLHASKIKDGSTLTYIDTSEFDDDGDEIPRLTDSDC